MCLSITHMHNQNDLNDTGGEAPRLGGGLEGAQRGAQAGKQKKEEREAHLMQKKDAISFID